MMKKELNIWGEFGEIINFFSSYDVPLEYTYTFIDNNLDFILENKDSFCSKLYFLFNKNDMYGVIYSDDNDYYWSILNKNVFSKFESVSLDSEKNNDYIVDMIINFADSEKLSKIEPSVIDYNIEEKLKLLKKIKLNSNGYHVR